MARSSKTVASQIVRHLMLQAASAGLPEADFLRRTGIGAEELEDPRGRIGRARFERVLAISAELPGPANPVPGLGWLEQNFPVLAAAWLNAASPRAAVQAYLRYRPILGETDLVTFRDAGSRVRLEYRAEGPPSCGALQALANFSLVVGILRAFDQGAPTRFCAGLVGAARPEAEAASALLGGWVRSGEPVNFLEFDGKGLDVPSAMRNPLLDGSLVGELERDLAELLRDASLSLTVERELRWIFRSRPRDASPEKALERICEMLRVTRWTLRRRLAQEGCTFQELQVAVKLEEARRLLQESSLTVGEVSDRLGFCSQSSFSRFFRGEVGMAPNLYRQAVQPGQRGEGARGSGDFRRRDASTRPAPSSARMTAP